METLCCHRWPLNIREVTNLAKRVLALHGHEKMLKRSHLVTLMGDGALEPARKTDPGTAEPAPPSAAADGLTPAEREERQRIIEVLDRCAGNQTVAAKKLNMSRSTLVLKLKRYGIRRPQADRERKPRAATFVDRSVSFVGRSVRSVDQIDRPERPDARWTHPSGVSQRWHGLCFGDTSTWRRRGLR